MKAAGLWIWALLALGSCQEAAPKVQLTQRGDTVEVRIGGRWFTTYFQPPDQKKPVLYPVFSPSGHELTRGWPYRTRPGEQVDHPHHVGVWMSHGDVNGFDFWNNSEAIPMERRAHYGHAFHESISAVQSGDTGLLAVTARWISGTGEALLEEETTFRFWEAGPLWCIERCSQLTALTGVVFRDSKEGMFAIRVCSALEAQDERPRILTRADGTVSDTPFAGPVRGTGLFKDNQGRRGDDVWGQEVDWVLLTGSIEGNEHSIFLAAHPGNPGGTTRAMTRGYGLFALNPMGERVYTDGVSATDFQMKRGATATFRFLIGVGADSLPTDGLAGLIQKWRGDF